MPPSIKTPAITKAEETRSRILAAALELFRSRGFDQTTMREIATEAGVALGSAYYYFASKEALVIAFYRQASEEMSAQIENRLNGAKGLESRLRAILDVKFEYFAPNRLFLGALSRHAADPHNPLSPFSNDTAQIRELDLKRFAAALAGSRMAMPKDIAPYLPNLIWLYQMGLILFWISDRSPGQIRTQQLRDKSLSLVVTALKLAGFPLLRRLRKKIVDLLSTIEVKTYDV
ncbi:MAG TPA: TetR/AcrR family transcriptional regulator [Bryobacteraceae bacterium]|jgi:AcrR family transcriptional regulator|nr:TetR/AcrR family transcriptional regulator [Bryobacteraceae bacterium]